MATGRSVLSWLMAILAALAAMPAAALDPSRSLKQYHHTAWTLREGAPPDAWAMAQTTDGLLWFGSPTGLYSFDGHRFEHFRPSDGSPAITRDVSALLAEPDGGLWIGLRSAGPVMHLKEGRLKRDDSPSGLGRSTVNGFARDHDGVLWAINVTQLMRLVDGVWQDAGMAMGLPPKLYLTNLLVDRRGTLWLQGPTGTFIRSRGADRFTTMDVQLGRGDLTEASDGRVWYGGEPQLRTLSDTRGQPERDFTGLPTSVGVGDVLSDRDGALWFVLEGKVGRLREPQALGRPGRGLPAAVETFALADGLSGDAAHTFFEDRDGNLWVTTNGGVDRFRKPKLNSVDTPLGAEAGWAVAGKGAVWAATGYGGLKRLDGRSTEVFPSAGIELTSLYRDPEGTLWIGAFDRLMRSKDGRTFELVELPVKPPHSAVRAIARDAAGALWVLMFRSGLYRLKDGRWEANGGLPAFPRLPQAMTVDATGRIWLAFSAGSVLRLDTDRAVEFKGPDLGAPQALFPDGDHLWLGTTDGLALLQQGQITQLLGQGDERFEGVSGIVRSDDGELWLNAADGVFRIPAGELDRAAAAPTRHRIAFQLLDHNDGLQGIATQLRPVPSAIKGDDGRLWFSTSRNLFWIDPAALRRNERPPQPRLRVLRAHGTPYEPGPQVQLPKGSSQFDIEYTAVELSLPEKVRFRYRLEGVDADWQDAQARRQALYTNLGPGDYRFSLMAANEDGVWSEPSPALTISIPPAFYQTRWFAAMCVAGALLLLWLGHRLRLRQATLRIQSRLEAQAQERERIARELHDTLLQGTQGLILSFSAIAERFDGHSETREQIDRALRRAEGVMDEGRRRVQDLRARQDGHAADLLQSIVATANGMPDAGPRITGESIGVRQELRPWAFDELVCVGQEAVLNAHRHAQATRIAVTVEYAANELRLSVRDDGRGFAADVLAAGAKDGHWGLVGMRERVARLGGSFSVGASPSGGAEIRVVAPMAKIVVDLTGAGRL